VAGGLALSMAGTAAAQSTLRVVMHSDLKIVDPSLSVRLCGLFDGLANAGVRAAAANVARHGLIYFGVRWMRIAREERGSRHDLAGLAL
jgi:hypothetical protein